MTIIDPLFEQRRALIVAQRDAAKDMKWYTWRFTLHPMLWQKYKNEDVLSWKKLRFTEKNRDQIPEETKGVYTFLVDPRLARHPGTRFLLYVGKVEDQTLRQRYDQYLRDRNNPKARPAVQDMLLNWEHHLWFCYAPVADVARIGPLEDDLISAYIPPVNKRLEVEIRRLKTRADQ